MRSRAVGASPHLAASTVYHGLCRYTSARPVPFRAAPLASIGACTPPAITTRAPAHASIAILAVSILSACHLRPACQRLTPVREWETVAVRRKSPNISPLARLLEPAMPATSAILPGHPALDRYYRELDQYRQHGVTHELATRSAFQNLLATLAHDAHW